MNLSDNVISEGAEMETTFSSENNMIKDTSRMDEFKF